MLGEVSEPCCCCSMPDFASMPFKQPTHSSTVLVSVQRSKPPGLLLIMPGRITPPGLTGSSDNRVLASEKGRQGFPHASLRAVVCPAR